MNAGAFCHREFDPETGIPIRADVWFSDEMTPLVGWTWSFGDSDRYSPNQGSPPAALLLRRHCWIFCRCSDERWRERQIDQSMARVWPYVVGDIEKSEWYSKSDKSRSKHASLDMKGLGNSDDASINALESLRGFLPAKVEKSLDMMPGMSGSSTCSDRCHGPADCIAKSSPSCSFQPHCRVDPQSLTQTVRSGLGTASYAYATFMCLPKHPRSHLGGRDISSDQKMEMHTWPCACNATYVSHSCCQSETGQVWEEPTSFLGGLKT